MKQREKGEGEGRNGRDNLEEPGEVTAMWEERIRQLKARMEVVSSESIL